jgi:hypothetical protein
VATHRWLREWWWPHQLHDHIATQRDPHMLLYVCPCGATFGVMMDDAVEFGLV